MSELKPCPFCGGEPILHEIEAHTHGLSFGDMPIMPDYPGSWTIECCDVGMIKDTRAEVVAAWNRRAAPAQELSALPKWIDDAKGKDPFTDDLITEIIRLRGQQVPLSALPELPETCYNGYSDGSEPLYTADQMRAYGLLCRQQGGSDAWQPIETAPKDGSQVLLFLGSPWDAVEMAHWYEPWQNWQRGDDQPNPFRDEYCGIGCNVPTHWQPLPAPPTAAIAQQASGDAGKGGDRG